MKQILPRALGQLRPQEVQGSRATPSLGEGGGGLLRAMKTWAQDGLWVSPPVQPDVFWGRKVQHDSSVWYLCVCISCIKIPSSLSLDLSLALSSDSKRTKALSSIKSEDGFEKCRVSIQWIKTEVFALERMRRISEIEVNRASGWKRSSSRGNSCSPSQPSTALSSQEGLPRPPSLKAQPSPAPALEGSYFLSLLNINLYLTYSIFISLVKAEILSVVSPHLDQCLAHRFSVHNVF